MEPFTGTAGGYTPTISLPEDGVDGVEVGTVRSSIEVMANNAASVNSVLHVTAPGVASMADGVTMTTAGGLAALAVVVARGGFEPRGKWITALTGFDLEIAGSSTITLNAKDAIKIALGARGRTKCRGSFNLERSNIDNTGAARTDWSWSGRTTRLRCVRASVDLVGYNATTRPFAQWNIEGIPDGAEITGLLVGMVGGPGHTSLPSGLPTVSLKVVNINTGVETTIAAGTSNAANVAAYNAAHTVGGDLISHTFDASTEILSAEFGSEYGTFALTDAVLSGVQVSYNLLAIES